MKEISYPIERDRDRDTYLWLLLLQIEGGGGIFQEIHLISHSIRYTF